MYHEKCISIEMINDCSLVCSCPTDFKPTHHRNLSKRVLYRGDSMYAFYGELSYYK